MDEQRIAPNQAGRLGPLFAGIWLFFLIDPLTTGWQHRHQATGVLGMLATLAFAAVYMALWLAMRRGHRVRFAERPPMVFSLPYLAGMLALGSAMIACLGETGLASLVYLAVAAVMVLPLRLAAGVIALLVLAALTLSAVSGWGSQLGLVFSVVAASFAVFGMRMVVRRNLDLVRAEQENAQLAVENERTRFARDLHDILGHSLTVITVKAELAQRLIDVDPARARTELADLERLSRDALSDVRRAVEGYRELTLPGELVRARGALDAAGIEADLPNSVDDVPSDLRELFAWTVREGITNVIRHSAATRCSVVLTERSAEVRDNGRGLPPEDSPGGSGLLGLRERAAALGGRVVTKGLDPGFSLTVTA